MARVQHTTAVQGPAHDPYHVDEWTVEKNGKTYILVAGMTVWASIEGRHVAASGPDAKSEHLVVVEFENAIGCSLKALAKAYYHSKYHCSQCGHPTETMAGFPGEYHQVCPKCNHVQSTSFRRSEVE